MSEIVKLPSSFCPEHNQPYESYCSHEKCDSKIRVCPSCTNNHSDHLKFLTDKKQVIEDLNKGLKRCFDKIEEYDLRSVELTKIMQVAVQRAHNEYEVMQNRLIDRMKEDKQILQAKAQRMRQLGAKIQEKQRIKTYFAKMQQNNLFQLRIKLSTIDGMKNLKQKSEKLRELTSKSCSDELLKLYEQFYECRREMNYLLQNNISFKVSQIIALKYSKRVNERREVGRDKMNKEMRNDEKENIVINKRKQKARPKTTLNFGDGIINGIMNFLNF